MPTTFHLPEPLDQVLSLRDEVIRRWHQKLLDAEVRVDIVFAANADSPPLKHGGYPCAALVKIESLEHRVRGLGDAVIKIDEHVWAELEDDSKVALLDHELSHLDTIEEESPTGGTRIKRDDIGRPKLQTIDGDWNAGDGFVEVVKRHGEAALEVVSSRRVHGIAMGALQEAFEEAE